LIQHVSFTARTTGFKVAVLAFDGWVSYLGFFGADDATHDGMYRVVVVWWNLIQNFYVWIVVCANFQFLVSWV
jgi:hypothetical protein